mmetsp:Transcript_33913/g.88306  ORF Transcript_33913/g.88306 Transcript_33913/m.88306 type:complete len:352 (+) Transcript_33913:135-1190(+)
MLYQLSSSIWQSLKGTAVQAIRNRSPSQLRFERRVAASMWEENQTATRQLAVAVQKEADERCAGSDDLWRSFRDSRRELAQLEAQIESAATRIGKSEQSNIEIAKQVQRLDKGLTQAAEAFDDFEKYSRQIQDGVRAKADIAEEATKSFRQRLDHFEAIVTGLQNAVRDTAAEVTLVRQDSERSRLRVGTAENVTAPTTPINAAGAQDQSAINQPERQGGKPRLARNASGPIARQLSAVVARQEGTPDAQSARLISTRAPNPSPRKETPSSARQPSAGMPCQSLQGDRPIVMTTRPRTATPDRVAVVSVPSQARGPFHVSNPHPVPQRIQQSPFDSPTRQSFLPVRRAAQQ